MLEFKRFSIENNTEQLYSFMNSIERKFQLPDQPDLPLFSEFCGWLSTQISGFYHTFFLVYEGEYLVGYVVAYDYRKYDRHCKVTGYIKDSLLSEALVKFVEYLISEYPLNKIFIETMDANLIETVLKIGFVVDAVLKEYKYYDSKYNDMHILSYTSMCKTTFS